MIDSINGEGREDTDDGERGVGAKSEREKKCEKTRGGGKDSSVNGRSSGSLWHHGPLRPFTYIIYMK